MKTFKYIARAQLTDTGHADAAQVAEALGIRGKDRACPTCVRRKCKLWVCRICGAKRCEHYCKNKTPDHRAYCGCAD